MLVVATRPALTARLVMIRRRWFVIVFPSVGVSDGGNRTMLSAVALEIPKGARPPGSFSMTAPTRIGAGLEDAGASRTVSTLGERGLTAETMLMKSGLHVPGSMPTLATPGVCDGVSTGRLVGVTGDATTLVIRSQRRLSWCSVHVGPTAWSCH